MNIPVVLSPQSLFSFILFAVLWTSPAFPQVQPKTAAIQRDTFSAEEEKFEHAVPLRRSAKEALASEQSVADVLKDDKLSVETMPEDWFTAAEVHLSSSTDADLIVMGDHIARGAYTSGFWVLRRSPEGYRVVFRNDAHDLELLEKKTNGLRNILTAIITLRYNSTDEYEFDGNIYKIARRTLQPNAYDFHLDPSNYKTRKSITQLPGQDSDFVRAEAREWIWRHWQSHQRSFLQFSTKDDDGENQTCSYFIDDDSENGEWQVTLKIHQTVWDQDSPSGPRYMVAEDRILIANKIERTEPAEDDSKTPLVIADDRKLPASDYRLNFIDDGDFSVATL